MNERDEALRYAAADMHIFPVNAAKRPLTPHGFKDASSDPLVIEAWLQKWPYCDFGLAVPATMVVVDIDMSAGRNGFADFKRLAECDPHEVATPQASTPSGGMHIFFAASRSYKNAVAIAGTGIDVRSLGGYVVLPHVGEWPRVAAPPDWRRRRHGPIGRSAGVARRRDQKAAVGSGPAGRASAGDV